MRRSNWSLTASDQFYISFWWMLGRGFNANVMSVNCKMIIIHAKTYQRNGSERVDVRLLLKLAAIEMNNMELKLNKSEFEIENIDLSLWLWIKNNSPSFSACLPVVADCWLITFQLIVFFCCFIWFLETPCPLSFIHNTPEVHEASVHCIHMRSARQVCCDHYAVDE